MEQRTFLIGPNPTNQRLEDLDLRIYNEERMKIEQALLKKQTKKPLVINLFGGPGTGKSTNAAEIFALLKREGINCELVREYAKDKVWEGHPNLLKDQIYVFAKQNRKLHTVADKVDIVITDSPLLLSVIYGQEYSKTFHDLVYEQFEKYNNLNIFLIRTKNYNPSGRLQTLEEAKEIDWQIKTLLKNTATTYFEIEENTEAPKKIIELIRERV